MGNIALHVIAGLIIYYQDSGAPSLVYILIFVHLIYFYSSTLCRSSRQMLNNSYYFSTMSVYGMHVSCSRADCWLTCNVFESLQLNIGGFKPQETPSHLNWDRFSSPLVHHPHGPLHPCITYPCPVSLEHHSPGLIFLPPPRSAVDVPMLLDWLKLACLFLDFYLDRILH